MLECLSCNRITKAWFLFVRLAHNKDTVDDIFAFGEDTSAYVYWEWEWVGVIDKQHVGQGLCVCAL